MDFLRVQLENIQLKIDYSERSPIRPSVLTLESQSDVEGSSFLQAGNIHSTKNRVSTFDP